MKGECLHTVEGSSSDIISKLPETVLETILCLLPTKEAARTSILAREWRYKWTKLPKLEFRLSQVSKRITNEKQVKGENGDRISELFHDLHQILLSHQGPIQKFSLIVDLMEVENVSFKLDEIVLLLLKNHAVKKLKLYGWSLSSRYNLPISVFSLHHLTDLYLSCVDIDHVPIFNGFSSLRSLVLAYVGISTKTLLHLLSNCPSLKSLNLHIGDTHIGGKDCTITELFKCLPVIEHLTVCVDVFEWLVLDLLPKELPTSLFHLKYFCFECLWRLDCYALGFLLVLIKCSPNLEKIKLDMEWCPRRDEEYSFVWKEYSDVSLEHLTKLKIAYFRNSKAEMDFMKFILARSPKLKKLSITSSYKVSHDEEYSFVWKEYSDVSLEHLTKLKIAYFSNSKAEMDFLKFILARSPKLKKLSITSSYKVSKKNKLKILQVLLQAPHASRNLCFTVDRKNFRSVNFLEN